MNRRALLIAVLTTPFAGFFEQPLINILGGVKVYKSTDIGTTVLKDPKTHKMIVNLTASYAETLAREIGYSGAKTLDDLIRKTTR